MLLVLDVVLAEEINNMTLVLALLLWSVKATVSLPCVCGKEDGTPDQQLRISSILGADAEGCRVVERACMTVVYHGKVERNQPHAERGRCQQDARKCSLDPFITNSLLQGQIYPVTLVSP